MFEETCCQVHVQMGLGMKRGLSGPRQKTTFRAIEKATIIFSPSFSSLLLCKGKGIFASLLPLSLPISVTKKQKRSFCFLWVPVCVIVGSCLLQAMGVSIDQRKDWKRRRGRVMQWQQFCRCALSQNSWLLERGGRHYLLWHCCNRLAWLFAW